MTSVPHLHLQATVEDWDRMHSVNGRGVFLCYKHAALQMIKQARGGRIIGAASIAGCRGRVPVLRRMQMSKERPGWPLASAYSATKFAVRGLTQVAGEFHRPCFRSLFNSGFSDGARSAQD